MNPPKMSPLGAGLAVALALLLSTMLATASIAAEASPGSGAQNGVEQAPDPAPGFSLPPPGVHQYWHFENYSFSLKMPEPMTGYFYPGPYMMHGVLFPLGPEKKSDDPRYLVAWARYENEAMDAEKMEELVWEDYLQALEGRDANTYWARFYDTIISGITFRCYRWHDGERDFVSALAFNPQRPTIVYEIKLASSKATWEQDYALFKHALETFRPEAPEVREGRSAFTDAMRGLYNSPDTPVRVLAYVNTLKIPRHGELEKELRARLTAESNVIEQYIILYVLASMTHYEPDFAALVEHVLHHRNTVIVGSQTMLPLGKNLLVELYPWMAHNNVYKRDAWLCGFICLNDQINTYSSEARSYLNDFSAGAPYPPSFPYYLENNPQDNGFSKAEMAWLNNNGGIPKEDGEKWMESFDGGNISSAAWEATFKAFLPLMALGGEDAKLTRQIVALASEWPREDFEQKYGKMLVE